MNNMVFVFGSNQAGIHGAGAALTAVMQHGAVRGQGVGRQGNSYAIPTKDHRIQTLPIHIIRFFAKEFVQYAATVPETNFQLTRVGCGLAGYLDSQMAPLFEGAPQNVFRPPEWVSFIGGPRW